MVPARSNGLKPFSFFSQERMEPTGTQAGTVSLEQRDVLVIQATKESRVPLVQTKLMVPLGPRVNQVCVDHKDNQDQPARPDPKEIKA